MADRINPNLNNLFQNWQNKKKYEQNAYDVNGDRIINYKDKKKLQDNEKNLLKNDKLFDVNNDGKLNQEDVNLFLRGDIDGDGKVTDEELSFVSLYKDDFTTSFNKQKIDFVMDGIAYSGGKKATGEINGQYYKNGVLFTGKTGGKTYVYGNLLSDGDTYKINSNKIAVITSKDGKTVKCCKEDGIIYSTITDSNLSAQPSIKWGDAVEFEGGKTLAIRNGDTAVINSNGNVVVTSKDGKTKKVYDKNGNLYATITNNNTANQKPSVKWGDAVEFEGGKTIAIRNGDTAVINSNGKVVVTSKDGNSTITYNIRGYIEEKSIISGNEKIEESYTYVLDGIYHEKTTYKYSGDPTNPQSKLLVYRNEQNNDDFAKEILIQYDNNGNRIFYYFKESNYITDLTEETSTSYPSKDSYISTTKVYNGNVLEKEIITQEQKTENSLSNEYTIKNGKGELLYSRVTEEQSSFENDVEINRLYLKITDTQNPENNKAYETLYRSVHSPEYNTSTITKKIDNDGDGIFEDIEEIDLMDLDLSIPELRMYSALMSSSSSTLSERLKSDIEIVKNALKMGERGSAEYNASIKSQMISTPSSMKNEVGEIVEKSDGLYVNDGNGLIKLGISAETYLELFPPIERYDINQGNTADCYFVSGCLIDMMKNPKTFANIIQMFSEDENGNISINFEGTLKSDVPVTFKNGELQNVDGKVDGVPVEDPHSGVWGAKGIKMLEQAYAILRFAKDESKEITSIDIDEALSFIDYGSQAQVYSEIFSGISEMYSTNEDGIDERIAGVITDKIAFLEQNAGKVNNGEMILSSGFDSNYKQFGIVAQHAYSVEKIDIEKGLIYIINPYNGASSTMVPFYELEELFITFNTYDLSQLA